MGLTWRGLFHDLSKFRPSEYFPYLEHFYGDRSNPADKRSRRQDMRANKDTDFDLAWLKHIHRNPHHWQFWLLVEDQTGVAKTLEMPEKVVIEMVCDWIGAGRAQGYYVKDEPLKEVNNWYRKNGSKIVVSERVRGIVEDMIGFKEQA